ncbi:hypothetical protein SK128_026692 [Halocaridina rubra]|uniref:Uncharacterized protein n=1 Tax=Halocaridina rubra TaxID=373956 RepID=A0AAN8ZV09_HALRR
MSTTIKPVPDICKTSNSCASAGGFCDYNCPPEARMDSSLCEGNCTCCLPPEPEPCNTTTACDGLGGYCSYTCLPGEDWKYGTCDGNCACCVPPKIPKPCNQTDCCSKLNGRCDSYCMIGLETTIPGLCASENCSCCIPGVSCAQSQTCFDRLGYCQSHCSQYFLSLPELCTGSECTCCAPPLPTTQIECQMMGGYCYSEDLGQICSTMPFGMCEDGSGCCLAARKRDIE